MTDIDDYLELCRLRVGWMAEAQMARVDLYRAVVDMYALKAAGCGLTTGFIPPGVEPPKIEMPDPPPAIEVPDFDLPDPPEFNL